MTDRKPLEGMSAIITGASQGFGRAVAKAYVAAGANVLICARSGDKLNAARDQLNQHAASEQIVAAVTADVSDPDDVDRLVATALDRLPGLDILVNNAGIVGPIGPAETVGWTDWTRTVQINLYGSVLPCRAVIPHFRNQKRGRIVQVSAGGATSPDPAFSAYASSKAAAVSFAATLAEEVRADGITVNALAPGGLSTSMNDEKLAAGPELLGEEVYQSLKRRQRDGGVPLELGAELAVFLGSDQSAGITGKLISAVWDDWHDLLRHVEDLTGSDVYTLRRILPDERGFSWGKKPT